MNRTLTNIGYIAKHGETEIKIKVVVTIILKLNQFNVIYMEKSKQFSKAFKSLK